MATEIVDFSIESYNRLMEENKERAFKIFEMIPKNQLTGKILIDQLTDTIFPMDFIKAFPIEKIDSNLIADIVQVFVKDERYKNRDDDINHIDYFMSYLLDQNVANQQIGAVILENIQNYTDKDGNLIYTPYIVRNIYDTYYASSDFHEPKIKAYYEKLVDYEINHPNAHIQNPKQTSEYEREMITNKKMKLVANINSTGFIAINARIDPAEKTSLYNLSVILQCMPEHMKDNNLKEKVNDFFNKEIESYKNENNKEAIKFLKEFYKNNDEIFMNIDKRIFESDKYINLLGADKLEVLANYSEIQEVLTTLSDEELTFFSKMIDYVADSTKSNENDVGDWIPMADIILDAIKDEEKSLILFKEFSQVGYENLTETQKNKFLNVVYNSQNWFDIKDIKDLDNYEKIKKNICLKILQEPGNIEGIPEKILKLDEVERAKFAKLQLTYGIDLVQANSIIKKYGENINENLENKDIGKILSAIKMIYNAEDLELLRDVRETDSLEADYNIMLNIESKLREHYLNEYKETLYQVKENDKINIDAKYEGKKIDVFEPQDDFNMIVHALGAYSQKGKKENFKDAWNISKMESHSLCTSYVGNNFLATARIVDVVYGFTDFSQEQLLLSAPWDIVSKYDNMNFATANAKYNTGNGVKFLSPKDEINNTRHTHNEMVFDRRKYEKGQQYTKLQPSYLIYIPDYTEDLEVLNVETNKKEVKLPGIEKEKIIEAINNRDETLKRYMENDPKWAETQKAAAQFGVPIVIIDRAKEVLKQSEKIQKLVKDFEETIDESLIEQIIVEFENNRTASREYHTKLEDKFFSNEIMDGYVNKIINTINTDLSEEKLTQKYDKLKSVLNNEIEKRNSFRKTENDEICQYWTKKIEEISSIEKEQVIRLSNRAIRNRDFVPVKDEISSVKELKENFEGISNDKILKVEKSIISMKEKSRNHRQNQNKTSKQIDER